MTSFGATRFDQVVTFFRIDQVDQVEPFSGGARSCGGEADTLGPGSRAVTL